MTSRCLSAATLAFALLSTPVLFVGAHAGENLIANPGFETLDPRTGLPESWRITRWGGPEGKLGVSTVSHSGRYSLKMAGLEDRTNLVALPTLGSLKPGHTYVFGCWFKTSGGSLAYAYVIAYDAQKRRILNVQTPNFRQVESWKKMRLEFTLPSPAPKRTMIVLKNAHGRGVVWYDDAALWDKADGPPEAKPASAERVVLSEDFSGPELDKRWQVVSGKWAVARGALRAAGPGAVMVFAEPLARNLRVEYTAWTEDPPCDLSALLAVPLPLGKSPTREGYLFGFGSMRNTKNVIYTRGNALIETRPENFADGIVQGRKHRVMVEKSGKRLSLTVDGKRLLEAEDTQAAHMPGLTFGFYIWDSGFVDDVRVTALPDGAKGEMRAEVKPTVAEHLGFDGQAVGGKPRGLTSSSRTARTVDEPTWVYRETLEATVTDPCVELRAAGGHGSLSRSFAPVTSGIVEMDLRALSLGRDGFRVALLDANGEEAGTLHIDLEGVFRGVTPEGERLLYTQQIEIPHRFRPMDLRWQTGRWYTLRLAFDAGAGVFHVALINLYTQLANKYNTQDISMARYLTVESDVPFRRPAGLIAGVALHCGTGATMRLDNLCVIGPVGSERVNGKNRRLSARELLGLSFPLRKDPPDLKVYSLRNVCNRYAMSRNYCGESCRQVWTPGGSKYRSFHAGAATRYNDLLVRQAFVDERRQMLDRTAFHLKNAGRLSVDLARRIDEARAAAEEAGARLAEAYRAYAQAYLDSLNETRLKREFAPAADRLETSLSHAESAIDACIDALPADAVAGDRRVSVPLPIPDDYPEWRDGQYRRADGSPAAIFPLSGRLEFPRMERSLRLKPLQRGEGRLIRRLKPGEIVDIPTLERVTGEALNGRPEARLWVRLFTGSNDLLFTTPRWWVDKYRSEDPDAFVWTPDGKPTPGFWAAHGYKASCGAHLNFWHPKVRALADGSLDAIAAWYRTKGVAEKIDFYELGAEISNQSRGYETGHNRTAKQAFRRFLKQEYGDVGQLNRTWGTAHASFNAIEPPKRAVRPCGVQYEFHRFRNLAHTEWRRACARVLKKHTPHIPILLDFHSTMGGVGSKGFDMPALMGCTDILGWHTYRPPDFKFSNRWLANLRDAMGTVLGNMEWSAAMGLPTVFSEEGYKHNGLGQAFHMMMWGQSVQGVWYAHATGWSPGANWTEPRLAHIVLRYSASFLPLMIDRARRIGRPALDAPAATPDIGILEVTSSYYNGWPQGAAREGMAATARKLEAEGFHYGFFYEALLLDGRQSLDGVQALVVPNAICTPSDLAGKLGVWVESGGTLIAYAPPGVYDRYGRPSGRLLQRVWPGVAWNPDGYDWKPSGANAPRPAEERPSVGAVYRARAGRGQVVLYSRANAYDALASAAFADLRATTTRVVFCERGAFDLALRRLGERRFLYALNDDLAQARADTVHVRGRVRSIADLNAERPVWVPHRLHDGDTLFELRLAPAEGTLLELSD